MNNRAYEAREMMRGYGDTFSYFQCSKCGCLQIQDVPSDMSKYYADDYYSYQRVSDPHGLKKALMTARNRYCVFGRGGLGPVLSWLYPTPLFGFLAHISIDRHSRILDVGCGAGKILFSLQGLGFENLLGVDPFLPEDIRYENGLTIRKQGIEEVAGEWDVITFHHSFEHILDPRGTLRNVRRLLRHGAICVIRIPTVSSYAWEHYGVNWVQLDAPRHFYLHSIQSMESVGQEMGFELCGVVYDSTSIQFWGSEQYVKGIPLRGDRSYAVNPRNSEFSKRQIRRFEGLAARLNAENRGDQAIFYLRKTENSDG